MSEYKKQPAKKRQKSIKIWLHTEEFERLNLLKTKSQRATWMREFCLNADKEMPAKKSKPLPKIDLKLLRQFAGVGNNLNQIARHVNSQIWGANDSYHIILTLKKIESELSAIRKNLANPTKNSEQKNDSSF